VVTDARVSKLAVGGWRGGRITAGRVVGGPGWALGPPVFGIGVTAVAAAAAA